MLTSANSKEAARAGEELRTLSDWSAVSLVFFALAVLSHGLALVAGIQHAVGPADAAELAFLLLICFGAGLGSTVLGWLTGRLGVRRSRGYPELPWPGLCLNSALLFLELVLAPFLLAASEPAAGWIMAPLIVLLGCVFAAFIGASDLCDQLTGVAPSAPTAWPISWALALGLACGAAAMSLILRLIRSG